MNAVFGPPKKSVPLPNIALNGGGAPGPSDLQRPAKKEKKDRAKSARSRAGSTASASVHPSSQILTRTVRVHDEENLEDKKEKKPKPAPVHAAEPKASLAAPPRNSRHLFHSP